MSEKKQGGKYPLLNLDLNDFPKVDKDQKAVISLNPELAGCVSIEKRTLNVATENFTIDGIERQLQEFDRVINEFEARKLFFQQILEYAKENGVPQNDMVIQGWMNKKKLEEQIKDLEEMPNPQPADIATKKALQRKLDAMNGKEVEKEEEKVEGDQEAKA